jgi:hypothetical protein
MFALFVKLSYDLHLPAVTGYIPQSTGENRLNELLMLAHLFDTFCSFSILEPLISQSNLHPLQVTSTVRGAAMNFLAPTGTHLRATSTTATETGATLLATCVFLLLLQSVICDTFCSTHYCHSHLIRLWSLIPCAVPPAVSAVLLMFVSEPSRWYIDCSENLA